MLQVTPESLREALPRCEGERYAITADARIDNRAELIASLRLDRQEFYSDSDLILRAYEKWGEECPDRLIGDFAFAIWDVANRQMFCACDPMGVKTLYYHLTPKAFSLVPRSRRSSHFPMCPANSMNCASLSTWSLCLRIGKALSIAAFFDYPAHTA